MSDDKNFLQTIKLEISRNFKLDPYERKAFHKVLGLVKSAAGKDILIKELERGGDVRLSALSVLSEFRDASLLDVFIPMLEKDISDEEKIVILNYINECTEAKVSDSIISLIEKNKDTAGKEYLIRKAFETLKKTGAGDDSLQKYLESVILDHNAPEHLLAGAVGVLSVFKNISVFEELLKRNNDKLSYSVFLAIYNLNLSMKQDVDVEDENLSPEWRPPKDLTPEDELLLQIKVLLGKMTSRYEDFSTDTKTSFLSAMLSCNHREAVIYVMRALESRDLDLVRKTLYSLHSNIVSFRYPEKIFRSLISMNVESGRYNDLIVDIFTKYFTERSVSRSDILFRDKMYGYISNTMETFFETYRREFMIPDVVESSFPESFRIIRQYILKHLDPEHKRRFVAQFSVEGKGRVRDMIAILSEWVIYIDDSEREAVSHLLDLMLDEDKISRENTASRIDSVNFEKRYLQSRIIRLCNVICSLKIEGAAKTLVFIYNYLKKYPDKGIFDAAVNALCGMNYSYMLSEVEIMLTAGSPEEQVMAVSLLPLFTEKRLLNILVEFLKPNIKTESDITLGITNILAREDIRSNVNAAAVFRELIENNPDMRIKQAAITGLGHSAFSEDIDFLNELFNRFSEQPVKESIVKAIGSIMAQRSDYSRQHLSRVVQEYLKDPSIRVRIFSCMILIRLGSKDAFRSIKEMLIIKNKSIQREILSILRDVRTPDFYFFLVSLLREEFGICMDIIYVLEKLPQEDLKEIESFIVNIFRKFEMPQIGVPQQKEEIKSNVEKKEVAALIFDLKNFRELSENLNFFQLIELYLVIDSFMIQPVISRSGVVSHKDSSFAISWFNETWQAVEACSEIIANISRYNNSIVFEKRIFADLQVVSDTFVMNGDEISEYLKLRNNDSHIIPLSNCIIINRHAGEIIREKYFSMSVPEFLYTKEVTGRLHYEVVSPVNFMEVISAMLEVKEREIEKQKQLQSQIEAQVKMLSTGNRSMTSIAIAGELENVGIKIKSQLDEVEAYINRRSTDRELNKNVRQMLNNIYNLYRVEISKLQIK